MDMSPHFFGRSPPFTLSMTVAHRKSRRGQGNNKAIKKRAAIAAFCLIYSVD